MAKKILYQEITRFTWYDWDDKTVAEVLAILSELPQEATFDSRADYDYEYGVVLKATLETDQQEIERENAEAVEAKRIQDEYAERLFQQQLKEQKLIASKLDTDVAVWAYLQLHKDNPRKDDLDNLMRAYINLESQGHSKDSLAMQGIKECMEMIENG